MIQQLFIFLTHAVEGTPALAMAAAFTWGILSILLSPCHLASLPLIVGFIDNQGRISTRRAFWISALFAVGILITIAAIGAITAAAGRMMGDLGRWGNYFVALIFFLVGLYLLEVILLPFGPAQVGMKRKGPLAAFILGLVFGVALGPCTFAFMAPIIGFTLKKASEGHASYGAFLLLVYGIGHCSVIVFAGTCTELVHRYLNWNEKSKGAVILKKICGILILLAGLYLIYTAPVLS